MYHGANNFNVFHSNRFIPFAGPFLLGAFTGGIAASAFRPRPFYGPVPYGPIPYGPIYPGFY
jgi:hypothetical protein